MRIKLLLLGLAASATMMAQTTYKPQLTKGLVKNYNQDITLKVISQGQDYDATIHVEDRYEVTYASRDSAIIDYTVSKLDTQGPKEAIEAADGDFGLLLNKTLKASYNPDGTFRHILNAKELIDGTMGNAKQITEELFTDNNYAVKLQSSLMWMLMGKTITTGMTENFEVEHLNRKRTFTVSPDGRQVDVKITSGMTEEETKAWLKSMLEKSGQNIGDNFDQTYTTLKTMGMADIKVEGNVHINVGADDWVSSGESTLKMKLLGNELETTIKYTTR